MSHPLAAMAVERIASALKAQLAEFTQANRLLKLHTPLGTDVLLAESVECSESLSGLSPALAGPETGFRYLITALSTDAFIDPDVLMGQAVLLQLLCADSRTELRPFHGHVTAFEQLGANGGFARYRLTVEPWLAFLAYRRDSYVFQDKTVIEIVDEVFGDYAGQGALLPAWRWQLVDESVYPKRSLTIQHSESDLAFIARLLAEEGLFAWFEHDGDPAAPALGSHRLVIADANTAFAMDLGVVRFHRADATEAEDSLQRLDAVSAVGTSGVALSSWDYVSLDTRLVEQQADAAGTEDDHVPSLVRRDTPGVYRYADRAQGARQARTHARAFAVEQHLRVASGTQRRITAGCRFCVQGHSRFGAGLTSGTDADAATFITLRSVLHARNNLPADFSRGLDQLLPVHPVRSPMRAPTSGNRAQAPLVSSAASLLPLSIPYAPVSDLRRKPRVRGLQTATVVGLDGSPITTDRDHRVKVQFHWQRGSRSQSRLGHPGGDDNAPGNETSGTWVRVATPVAGTNWGGVFVPRVGQEVLVEFIEGDIDRPVIIGSVYNGQGQADAPGNAVGQTAPANTANAPAWFAGNGHPGAISGIKTQALSASQTGQGGFNHLLFDATPKQARFELATTQHATQLRLGHQRVQDGNLRAAPLGHGISLATDAYGAFRAGAGLLISADARAGGTHAGAQAMDAREAIQQLSEAEQLAQSLADTAKRQNAVLAASSGGRASRPGTNNATNSATGAATSASSPPPSETPAIAGLQASQTALRGTQSTTTGLAWNEPMIVTSAPDGIVQLTPDASLWSAGTHLSMTAGHAVEAVAQNDHRLAAKNGIVLFTHGSKPAAGSPEPLMGIQLHAAQGPVSLQAQSSTASLAARQNVRIASTTASVTMQAKEHLLLTAQGAYIRMHDGNIEVHAPGNVSFRGTKKALMGPIKVPNPLPKLPALDFTLGFSVRLLLKDDQGIPLANQKLRILRENGSIQTVTTDHQGYTSVIDTGEAAETMKIQLANREKWTVLDDEHSIDADADFCEPYDGRDPE